VTARAVSPRWVTKWLVVALFLVSLVGVTPRLAASDEIENFAWLRSGWFDRDVDFRNEYQHFYDAAPIPGSTTFSAG